MPRRVLQAILAIAGLVAVTFGALSVLLGVDAVVHAGATSANVDSEVRYYGAWYVLGGWLALRAARRPQAEVHLIRLLGATLIVGASGRAIGLAAVGRPHWIFVALMIAEVVVAALLLTLQAAVRRSGAGG